MGITKRGPCEKSGENEGREKEAAAAAGRFAGVPEAEKGSDVDSDSDLETEGDPRPVSSPWGVEGAGWGRVNRGPLSSRAGSAPLRGTPSGQWEATPAPSPPVNAPGRIKNSTIRTKFQSDIKILGRDRGEGNPWKMAGCAWGGIHILPLVSYQAPTGLENWSRRPST